MGDLAGGVASLVKGRASAVQFPLIRYPVELRRSKSRHNLIAYCCACCELDLAILDPLCELSRLSRLVGFTHARECLRVHAEAGQASLLPLPVRLIGLPTLRYLPRDSLSGLE